MTTGEIIVVAIFGIGVLCSLSLFWWLLRIVRRDRDNKNDAAQRVGRD